MTTVDIRPVEQKDLDLLGVPTYGRTIRGQVAVEEGVPIAIAGVIHTEPFYAFAHLTDAMRRYPKQIMKVIHSFQQFLSEHYTTVYAVADAEELNAVPVLIRAGFEYYMTTIQGDVYRWQTLQSH